MLSKNNFFCPEAIKSKQKPMCQKAKNSEKVIFEEKKLKIFGKSDSKVPKLGGGGILEKYHKKKTFFFARGLP